MVEELFDSDKKSKGPTVLLLCTVPVKPPSELPSSKVRLKNLTPSRVTCGQGMPVTIVLDTSPLEELHEYSAAFTHQWSNQTYTTEAKLQSNRKGVELEVPWQILAASSPTDGLYDVHLIVDNAARSENRRTLTVVSAESELSASSQTDSQRSTSGEFAPIGP